MGIGTETQPGKMRRDAERKRETHTDMRKREKGGDGEKSNRKKNIQVDKRKREIQGMRGSIAE